MIKIFNFEQKASTDKISIALINKTPIHSKPDRNQLELTVCARSLRRRFEKRKNDARIVRCFMANVNSKEIDLNRVAILALMLYFALLVDAASWEI